MARLLARNPIVLIAKFWAVFVPAIALLIAANPISAQPNTEPAIEEIVVTALKRGNQSLLDASAGISVLKGKFIDDLGAESLNDFLSTNPATSISSEGAGVVSIQIRGVNSTFGGASVGFYIDGMPFSMINQNFLLDPNPYDLENIEILRGPQGTLYGTGSAGGVVLINTADPVLNQFMGKVRVTGSSTHNGGDNYGAAGAINLPLVQDRLSLRATGSVQNNSGWIDGSVIGSSNVNDEDRQNYRLKLLAPLTDKLDATLLANIIRIDAGSDILADDSRLYPDELDLSRSNETDIYGLILNYEAPWFDIQNATSIIDYSQSQRYAVDPMIDVPTFGAIDTVVNELRLSSSNDTNFSWVAGLFYRDSDQFLAQAPAIFPAFSDTMSSEQISIYGDGTYTFMDGLIDVSAGLSYFEDDVTNTGEIFGMVTEPKDNDAQLWSPKASLAIYPTDWSIVYLTYAEGFRSAIIDFALSTFLVQQIIPTATGLVDPEELQSFEIGAKSEFPGGRLYGELIFFFTDIKDIQQSAAVAVPGTDVSANTVINAGNATTRGVEAVLSAKLTDGLDLTLAGSYTKAEIDGDFYAPGSDASTATPLFADGDPLNLVPELVLSGSVKYAWSVGSQNLEALAFVSVQHTSERGLTILASSPNMGDDITRVDARFEIGRDEWTIFLFGDNLTDESGAVAPSILQNFFDDVGAPYDGTLSTRLRPRTVGAGFRYEF